MTRLKCVFVCLRSAADFCGAQAACRRYLGTRREKAVFSYSPQAAETYRLVVVPPPKPAQKEQAGITPASDYELSAIRSFHPQGLGCGVGRALGIGAPLGVGVGLGVGVAVGVGVDVGVGVGVAVARLPLAWL